MWIVLALVVDPVRCPVVAGLLTVADEQDLHGRRSGIELNYLNHIANVHQSHIGAARFTRPRADCLGGGKVMHGYVNVRQADVTDAGEAAAILYEFNAEFDVPTPSSDVLGTRLRFHLASTNLIVLLASGNRFTRPIGISVVSLRPNVWEEGPVALLDELYVRPGNRNRGIGAQLLHRSREEARMRGAQLMEIHVDAADTDARRFYERHGFSCVDPTTGDAALYYYGVA